MTSIGILWTNTALLKCTAAFENTIDQISTTEKIKFLSKQGSHFAWVRINFFISKKVDKPKDSWRNGDRDGSGFNAVRWVLANAVRR